MDSYIPVCLSAIAGVVLSILAGTIVWQSESDRIEEQFPERADSLVLALQNSLDESLQVTRATGTLLEAAPALPREGFEQFSRTFVTRYPGLVELGWATIAPETNNISHLYSVSENASDDRPRQTDGDRRAITKAIRSSIAVATPPVPLTSHGDLAFTVYHPVYDSTDRESLRGVVYGVYRVQYWLKISLGALNLESLDFYLYGMPIDQLDSSLKKGTVGAQENFLVFYDSQQRLLITDREQLPATAIGMDARSYPNYCPFDRKGTTCIRTLSVADREWSLLVLPRYSRATIIWRVGTITVIGLLFTALLVSFLRSSVRHHLATEALNRRLSAELQVSRQLQQMLLPTESELKQISGLEIATYMEPADEVGGDYYDVLVRDSAVKIGIGDVTGHGLESGVLAIMVQTAVRTLLENNETDPQKFLDTINRTIYHNVQRMKCEKNLSLCLLDYQEGIVKLSGQHEEAIVIRANGIERVDTIDLGFPIGLDTDIAQFFQKQRILLDPGDGVVLYTDGITEAEDASGKFYGIDRLCATIDRCRHKSAQEILQAVIDDVRQHIGRHKVYDDITLLVLKR